MLAPSPPKTRFRLVLIKPSHYDDDGYVIQWLRSPIPANSLACLYGLAIDCAERQRARARRRARRRRDRRDQPAHPPGEDRALDHARPAAAWSCWSACSRTSFRARSTSTSRFAQLGLTVGIGGFHVSGTLVDAARRSSQTCRRRSISALHLSPARRRKAGSSRCLRDAPTGRLKPIYNFMDDLPGIERVPIPHLPAEVVQAHLRREHQLRRRPRLPVPVLVLHHHQRAGAEVAPPLAGRRRAHRARQPRARAPPLLHHRRQLRPQQGLGADLRPADRAAARRDGVKISASSSRSTRSATGCRTSSRRRRAPACGASSSGWRTSAPTISPRRRRSRTRSPNTARCCWPGRTSASSPIAATSSASRTTRRSGSSATSR